MCKTDHLGTTNVPINTYQDISGAKWENNLQPRCHHAYNIKTDAMNLQHLVVQVKRTLHL